MQKQAYVPEAVENTYPYRFAARCIFLFLAGALLTQGILWVATYEEPGGSYAESYRILSGLRSELMYRSLAIYLSTSFLVIPGIVVVSLLYSHRVAGPLHKLGRVARTIASGDLSSRVQLRRDDSIHSLAEGLNSVAAGYGDLITRLETKIASLKEICPECTTPSRFTSEQEMREAAVMIAEKSDEIRKLLFHIKV